MVYKDKKISTVVDYLYIRNEPIVYKDKKISTVVDSSQKEHM